MKELFRRVAEKRILSLALILVNLTGVVFGFFYYASQIQATPLHLLIFVPDSPAAVFLFALFLALYTFADYQHPALNLLTVTYLVKVGLWSVLVIFLFWPDFFVLDADFSALLILLHLGMILEALVVTEVWEGELDWRHALLVLCWFLLGDFVDYVVGTVPYPVPFIADAPYLGLLTIESVVASIVIVGLLYKEYGH